MTKSLDEIKEAYLYLKNHKYPELRRLQRVEESYYLQSFNPFPNEDKEHPYITHKVKPPRGRRIVDGPVDWLAMDKVVCHIPPKAKPNGEETLKAQQQADRNEQWAQALLDYLGMVQPYYLRMLAQQLPLRGEAWLKVELDWTYIQDPDGYDGVPFRWVVPDSMMTYAMLDMDAYSRPVMVFEEKIHTLKHLKELVVQWNPGRKIENILKKLKDVKDYQDVFLVEWTTPKERGYFTGMGGITEGSWYAVPIDGEDRVDNPAGIVPYIRGFSSLGIYPYDGDITKLVVGFLRPMGDVIVQDARDRSKIDTITNYWAAPITSWIKADDSIVLTDADTIIAPGRVYEQIRDRKELKIEPAPPIPSSLTQQLQLNEALLEEYDPMVLRGKATPGETAVGQNQRVGLGLSKWEPLKITLKQMLANAIGTTLQIVEAMDVPVKVGGKALTKDDVGGYYRNDVDIKPGNPEEQVRRMLLVKEMSEFLTEEEEARYMGDENASERARKLRLKKMVKSMTETPGSPLYQMVWSQAIKELGLEEIQAEIEAQAKMVGAPRPGQNTPTPQGPVEGASPPLGVPGVAIPPQPAVPPSQEDVEAAQNALGALG